MLRRTSLIAQQAKGVNQMPSKEYHIAAAYIRVSTDDQVELSPASQLVEIRKWASANGYIVPDEFVFVDEAKSGRKVTGRDDFRRLIGTAKQKPKPFDAILLWKFSRFARNRDDAVLYKSILRKQLHIDVISIKEPISEGKLGIIMEAMIEAMDEYYSINLAEEVKRGMEEKHRRGELQSTPSFGYSAQNGVLVPKEPEASYVREMFSRFLSGQGFYPIARWLNELGIKTYRGSPFENRTVEYILRNPVYIGKLRWNPAGRTRRNYNDPNILVVDGKHTPLIDCDMWNAVQDRIAQLKAVHKYHSRPLGSNKDWISGVVRCATCGGTLIFAKPNYWKCNNYVHGRCKDSQHISSDILKDAILARLQADAISADTLSFDVVRAGSKTADELSLLQQHRAGLLKRLERLREAYLAGAETLDEYSAAKSATLQQIQETDSRIDELEIKKTDSTAPDMARSAIRSAVDTLTSSSSTLEQKCEALHSICDRIDWDKAQNTLTIHYRIVLP